MEQFLSYNVCGNEIGHYLTLAFIFFGAALLLRLIKPHLYKIIEKQFAGLSYQKSTTSHVQSTMKCLTTLYILAAVYGATQFVHLPQLLDQLFEKAIIFILTLQTTVCILQWGSIVLEQKLTTSDKKPLLQRTLIKAFRFVVWSIMILFLLHNFGFNISAIMAGLGIGGIAIALAAQNILGDLFNYFVIFFDSPFEVGDTIQVGDIKGTIADVGIKTTRILSQTGEQVILPNSSLTSSHIRNYTRMQKKRVILPLWISYKTTQAELESVPDLIKKAISSIDHTQFDRTHLTTFALAGLEYEVVYFILSAHTHVHAAVQGQVHLTILRTLQEAGIALSCPSQNLYVV